MWLSPTELHPRSPCSMVFSLEDPAQGGRHRTPEFTNIGQVFYYPATSCAAFELAEVPKLSFLVALWPLQCL